MTTSAGKYLPQHCENDGVVETEANLDASIYVRMHAYMCAIKKWILLGQLTSSPAAFSKFISVSHT